MGKQGRAFVTLMLEERTVDTAIQVTLTTRTVPSVLLVTMDTPTVRNAAARTPESKPDNVTLNQGPVSVNLT